MKTLLLKQNQQNHNSIWFLGRESMKFKLNENKRN